MDELLLSLHPVITVEVADTKNVLQRRVTRRWSTAGSRLPPSVLGAIPQLPVDVGVVELALNSIVRLVQPRPDPRRGRPDRFSPQDAVSAAAEANEKRVVAESVDFRRAQNFRAIEVEDESGERRR